MASHRCLGSAAGAQPGAPVALRPDRFPPPAVVEIPSDRLAQARLEALAWLPTEFATDLCRVNRVALVMAGPVGDESDEPGVRPMRRVWQEFVEQIADRGHDFEVGALAIAPDVVAVSGLPAGQDGVEGAGMIVDIKPVADIVALAVDW